MWQGKRFGYQLLPSLPILTSYCTTPFLIRIWAWCYPLVRLIVAIKIYHQCLLDELTLKSFIETVSGSLVSGCQESLAELTIGKMRYIECVSTLTKALVSGFK